MPAAPASVEARVDAFVASLPGRGSSAVATPTQQERRWWADAVRAAADGDLTRARVAAEKVGYRVRRVAVGDERYLILEEQRRTDGSRARNWGIVLVDPTSVSDVIVEVTHPVFDVDSHRIGVAVFERTRARALLVAGAHRYANADRSADVAHTTESAFQAAHDALLRATSIVYQPHGFSAASHPGLGEVVLSAGASGLGVSGSRLAATLRDVADVCVYDGIRCASLAGTRNVQGRTTRAMGATFLHVEHARTLRSDPVRREQVVAATAVALTPRPPSAPRR